MARKAGSGGPVRIGAAPRDLVALCRALGDPEYAIMADGNVSGRGPRGTFWIKASGTSLASATAASLVPVRTEPILRALDRPDLADRDLRTLLEDSTAGGGAGRRRNAVASIETFMHAALLALDGVTHVGHTHPTAINMITCSDRFEELLAGRVFPEEVVVCGPESVLVPYADPGPPLARAIRDAVEAYRSRRAEAPKAIYLKNHGFIACGANPTEVLNITRMAVKAAKIRHGAAAVGQLSRLAESDIQRLHRRADIAYRKRIMGSS